MTRVYEVIKKLLGYIKDNLHQQFDTIRTGNIFMRNHSQNIGGILYGAKTLTNVSSTATSYEVYEFGAGTWIFNYNITDAIPSGGTRANKWTAAYIDVWNYTDNKWVSTGSTYPTLSHVNNYTLRLHGTCILNFETNVVNYIKDGKFKVGVTMNQSQGTCNQTIYWTAARVR